MYRNRTLWLSLIVIFLGGLLIFRTINKPTSKQEDILWGHYKVETKIIDGNKLRLVVADTPERWEKGLMFVRKPVSDFDGMIFIFPSATTQTFWNMNTFENLKIYWMKDGKILGTSDLPSIEKSNGIVTVSSPEPANIVVEVIQ